MIRFLIFIFFSSCSLITTTPDNLSFQQRLTVLNKMKKPKLSAPVKIYWNKYSIPFIETQSDEDLAFTLGVVHAHLRVDQLEILRRIAYGRLSEVAGPIPQVNDIDHALKIINFPKGARNSIKVMHPESLKWMKRFTQGLNWYIQHANISPVTNKLIDSELKRYTLEEVMSIGRIVGSDLSWITYAKYLKSAIDKNWEQSFEKSKEKLKYDTPSIGQNLVSFFEVLNHYSKSGSNSVVVSAKKSKAGSSLIASDPHVGLMLPNFWLMVGIKSPSYHAVGMMIPGVPIIGVGRNVDIAWGGTNMRAISTHLYDVTDLDESEITERRVTIKRRWWTDKDIIIKETPYGPIFSDVDFFEPDKLKFKAALDWQGIRGSDEIYTFLKIAKSKNWKEFRSSFEPYRVSAMNITYADKKGNIGLVAAYGQPVLKYPERTLDFLKKRDNPIVRTYSPLELPFAYNPIEGFIASANNKPFENTKIPFAFSYSNNHRVERLQKLISQKNKLSFSDLKELQLDVFSRPSKELQQEILKVLGNRFLKTQWYHQFSLWDGNFSEQSKGAIAFHGLMFYLAEEKFLEDMNWKVNLLNEIKSTEKKRLEKMVLEASDKVSKFCEEFETWGDFTQQANRTVFGMIPLIGKKYRYQATKLSGNADTINKYGRSLNLDKAQVSYGASARHISDLSSPNENYFVQNGGQDSWLMNESLGSQSELFRRGEYIRVPLEMEKVRKSFNIGTSEF